MKNEGSLSQFLCESLATKVIHIYKMDAVRYLQVFKVDFSESSITLATRVISLIGFFVY